MEWIDLLLATLFSVAGVVCLLLVIVGLPGTWILLGLGVLYELVDGVLTPGAAAPVTFGWRLLGIAALLAAGGEVLEALGGAAGTRLGGGTRRGMIGALVGGIAGAILLTVLLPIPFVGTLAGALAGTFLGALYAESTSARSRDHRANLRAALGAAFGRLAGTLGKLLAGVVMWALLVRAAFV